MNILLVNNLSFDPPPWPIFWAVSAWVLLGIEAVLLFARTKRARSVTKAVVVTMLGLLAGPILILAGLMRSISSASASQVKTTGEPGQPGQPGQPGLEKISLTSIGIVGAVVSGLALLVWYKPCLASIAAIALCASAWACRSYRRTTTPISRKVQLILLTMRIALIALIACWALRPVMLHTHSEDIRSILLIGVDTSASMQQKDMPNYSTGKLDPEGPIDRETATGRALWAEKNSLDEMTQTSDLQCFTFAAFSSPARQYNQEDSFWQELIADSSVPKNATAIGDSLQSAFDFFAAKGEDITDVILFSDGCNNLSVNVSPEKFASRLAHRKVAVHTVCLGAHKASAGIQALSVADIGAEQNVRAFSRMDIEPTIEAIGLRGRIVRLTCRFGTEIIHQQSRKVKSSSENLSFKFSHMPLKAGFHKLSVSVEVVGQAISNLAGKRSDEMLVHVSDREIRILYVEGKFRYETKYIARALASSERFSVHNYLVLRPLQRDRQTSLGENLEDWLRYHAIIFGDVSADIFSRKQLEIIKKLVSQYGKGFCMIGGAKSFGDGGWGKTPLADIMPVSLARSTGQINQPVQPLPTSDGEKSALMNISPNKTSPAELWPTLDAMAGANRLAGLKPAATVLAKTQRDEPMIVVQQYGKGRSLAIAFDTTWRWALSPNVKAAQGREIQQRFWRQVGLYLADPRGNVWIQTNRTTYDTKALNRGVQEIIVTAGVENAQGKPLEDAKYKVTLTDPKGKTQPVSMQRQGRILKTSLPPAKTGGIHSLRIVADIDGRKVSADQKFEVIWRDLETAEVLADFQQLSRIAVAGNGQCTQLSDLHDLLEQLKKDAQPKQRDVTEVEDILGEFRWPIFVAMMLLLCGAWMLRKKKGLV